MIYQSVPPIPFTIYLRVGCSLATTEEFLGIIEMPIRPDTSWACQPCIGFFLFIGAMPQGILTVLHPEDPLFLSFLLFGSYVEPRRASLEAFLTFFRALAVLGASLPPECTTELSHSLLWCSELVLHGLQSTGLILNDPLILLPVPDSLSDC